MTRTSKLAAIALIYKDGLFTSPVLGVSRKDNPNDMGMPGGKIDQGETLYNGMVREVYEETGLIIKEGFPFFYKEDNEYFAMVYLITKWEGIISTNEKGVVKWTNFRELNKGTFGKYNRDLEEHIKWFLNFKLKLN